MLEIVTKVIGWIIQVLQHVDVSCILVWGQDVVPGYLYFLICVIDIV